MDDANRLPIGFGNSCVRIFQQSQQAATIPNTPHLCSTCLWRHRWRTGFRRRILSGSRRNILRSITKRGRSIRRRSRIIPKTRSRRPCINIHRILPWDNQRRDTRSAIPHDSIPRCRRSRLRICWRRRQCTTGIVEPTIGAADNINRCHSAENSRDTCFSFRHSHNPL